MTDKGTRLFGGIGAANNTLSAPTSEPVRELVEALRELIFACKNQQQITAFGGLLERRLIEAERVLAWYQK
jgi:hypothetical protein